LGWSDGAASADDFYLVRVGRHRCFDRVVFDLNGPGPLGFDVTYADGAPVLHLVLHAPAQGYGTSGHQPGRFLASPGDDLVAPATLASWPSLRGVRFVRSADGESTITLTVAQKRPFRVGATSRDGYSHVYIDIAAPR